jgi:hypothetical protein
VFNDLYEEPIGSTFSFDDTGYGYGYGYGYGFSETL